VTGVAESARSSHLPVEMSLAGAGVSDVLASWDGQADDMEEERVINTVVNTHALAQDVRAATPTSVRSRPPPRTTFWELSRSPHAPSRAAVCFHTQLRFSASRATHVDSPPPHPPHAPHPPPCLLALPQVGSTDALRERLYAKDLALRTLLATQSPIVSPRGSTHSSAASPAASPQKPPPPASAATLRSRSPLGSPAKALTRGAHSHSHTTPPREAASAAVTSSMESPPSSPRLDAVRRRRPHSKHMQEYLNRMERLLAEVQTAHGQTGRMRPVFAAVGARLSKSVSSARRTAYASHVRSFAEDDSRWVHYPLFPISGCVMGVRGEKGQEV
jgi:hypothetical protein